MTDQNNVTKLSSDLNNWLPVSEVPNHFQQFTAAQLKRLFWQREKHAGLSTCYRQVGKRGYLNIPLFGLYLAGLLPEQQGSAIE